MAAVEGGEERGMDLARVVGIKRRQRISEAALSGLEPAEAEVLRLLVGADVPALVEEVKRLAGELREVRRRFQKADMATYPWYFGEDGCGRETSRDGKGFD